MVILSADTGTVDQPLMKEHIRKVREAIAALPIEIPFILSEPDVEDAYFVNVLGRGYKPPTKNLSWCVERLKIKAGRKSLLELASSEDTICQLLGSRMQESTARSISVTKEYGDGFFGQHSVANISTCAPIARWRARDVLTHLVRQVAPWHPYFDYGNSRLINLYSQSMGECQIGASINSPDRAINSCKASRMGCWACTVVEKDKSMESLLLDYPELSHLYEMREVLKAVQDLRYGGYWGIQRKGPYRFERGFGDLDLDIRCLLLNAMKFYGIELPQNEVEVIIRFVLEREYREGIPVTQRFLKLISSFLEVPPVFFSYDTIFNPTGEIDRCTKEDKLIIERLLAEEAAGQ